jgi:hypothetical protein
MEVPRHRGAFSSLTRALECHFPRPLCVVAGEEVEVQPLDLFTASADPSCNGLEVMAPAETMEFEVEVNPAGCVVIPTLGVADDRK